MSTPPGSADRPASAAHVAPRASVLDGADAATLRRLFHLTPTFLSISALSDGRLLDVNDAFVDITGYAREEVLGRPIGELDLWVDPRQRDEGLRELRKGARLRGVEARFRMKDGSERTMLLSGEIMPLGGRACVVTVLADITDRKRAEQALRESERQTEARREEAEALAEAAHLLTSSLDLPELAGEIVRRVRRLLHSDAASLSLLDLDGQHLTVQALAGDAGPLWRPGVSIPAGVGLSWRAVEEQRVLWTSDILAEPEIRWTADVLERVRTAAPRAVLTAPLVVNLRVVGALSVGDAAGRVYAEKERRLVEAFADHAAVAVANARLFRELEAANRGKDEFLAMLGHELRNPLGTIASAVDALDRVAADPAARQLSGLIGRQARVLGRLVDDLLDVARVASGKLVIERRPVDLRDVAARCLDALRQAGRTRAHEVSLDGAPAPVAGDGLRLEQVVANLVDNALKYTPPGGRVTVSTGRDGGDAVLRVADTGPGLPPELLPRVFDLFTQGPQGLDRSRGGLGLGLALVKRLVELHGGSVSAASAGPGAGAEFVVRLPARAGEALPAPAPSSPLARPTSARAPEARRRVLVVEDNADAREALRVSLTLAGHEVAEAADGPAGLEQLAACRPDVALIDVGLPGLDGYEVARRARQRDETRDVFLVALTGYGQAEDRRRALDAGFDRHLTKPVDPAVLREVMQGAPAGPRR